MKQSLMQTMRVKQGNESQGGGRVAKDKDKDKDKDKAISLMDRAMGSSAASVLSRLGTGPFLDGSDSTAAIATLDQQ